MPLLQLMSLTLFWGLSLLLYCFVFVYLFVVCLFFLFYFWASLFGFLFLFLISIFYDLVYVLQLGSGHSRRSDGGYQHFSERHHRKSEFFRSSIKLNTTRLLLCSFYSTRSILIEFEQSIFDFVIFFFLCVCVSVYVSKRRVYPYLFIYYLFLRKGVAEGENPKKAHYRDVARDNRLNRRCPVGPSSKEPL